MENEEIEKLIGELPKVENIKGNSGNEIKNQFEIWTNEFRLFQSYKSPIAMFKGGKVYIFRDWDYSTTTGKYRNLFLNETKKETLAKLRSGEYIAVDFDVLELFSHL